MSTLQRSALNARIAKLPRLPDGIAPSVAPYSVHDKDDDDDEEEEEEEEEIDELGELPSTATSNQYFISRFASHKIFANISFFLFIVQIKSFEPNFEALQTQRC